MASPQMLIELSKGFITRNNPVTMIVQQIAMAIDSAVNFKSQMKLQKFKFMLYRQQMQSIEQNMNAGITAAYGVKVDRKY